MKNVTRHVGTLVNLERMPSSVNGNPRFRLFIGTPTPDGSMSGVSCVKSPDSHYAYDCEGLEGKEVEARIGTHHGRATLESIRKSKQ